MIRELKYQAFEKEFVFYVSDYFREVRPYVYLSSQMIELHLPSGEDVKPSFIYPISKDIELPQSRLDTLQSYYD